MRNGKRLCHEVDNEIELYHTLGTLASEGQWCYPADANDLMLIRHVSTQPRDFHVLHLHTGSHEFIDCGRLEQTEPQ